MSTETTRVFNVSYLSKDPACLGKLKNHSYEKGSEAWAFYENLEKEGYENISITLCETTTRVLLTNQSEPAVV